MNEYEKLLAEFDNDITFKFRKDMPNDLPGLIIGNTVYLDPFIPFPEAITYLAEEIGHHKTLPDGVDITDQSKLVNRKLERKGREWGYRKLVPKEKIINFIAKRDQVMAYDLAEEFDLPDAYVEEVVNMYKIKGEI
ncbi:hypothetical protein WJ437_09145 [Ignavigranum ruoffiae]|uniref:hypothetical protein n=1 Tax=Ignavigranum ruoffiae TaxID=89093 RepID=UPI0023559A8D|nr:hypothetical protein [Ignavigranum ruoffiae]